MTNNLIFKNGAVFPICNAPAANAPSMLGGGWRSFHVVASCTDAAAALMSGVIRREYESYVDDTTTEILTEDLSSYTVTGSLCDHMDGTVTLWTRKPTELELVEHDLTAVSAVAAKANLTGENDLILDMPTGCCEPWVVGETYTAGLLRAYEGVKYLVMQNVTAAEHQPPNIPNGAMLAIYKPYQGREGYNWIFGEYCETGFTRYDNGVLYRAKSDPGANIYSPSQVPAVWEKV